MYSVKNAGSVFILSKRKSMVRLISSEKLRFLRWFSLFKKKVFKKFLDNSNILDMYIVYHDC